MAFFPKKNLRRWEDPGADVLVVLAVAAPLVVDLVMLAVPDRKVNAHNDHPLSDARHIVLVESTFTLTCPAIHLIAGRF